VEFPKGIKLVHAEVIDHPTTDHQVLSCSWDIHGRQKFSFARAPAMIVLTDPHYWHGVIHQLATHLEQTGTLEKT
jgi:hypothetical protein